MTAYNTNTTPVTGWRNRVTGHARVRAADLVPHPLNPRNHPDFQAQALTAVLNRLGFARSLLAYRRKDGRLGLIDGHLRQSLNPQAEVEVEIVDLTEDEAGELLLCLDPLARLALTDQERAETLRQLHQVDNPTLAQLFTTVGQAEDELRQLLGQFDKPLVGPQKTDIPTADIRKWLVVAECPSEEDQAELVSELRLRGFTCRSMAS